MSKFEHDENNKPLLFKILGKSSDRESGKSYVKRLQDTYINMGDLVYEALIGEGVSG